MTVHVLVLIHVQTQEPLLRCCTSACRFHCWLLSVDWGIRTAARNTLSPGQGISVCCLVAVLQMSWAMSWMSNWLYSYEVRSAYAN